METHEHTVLDNMKNVSAGSGQIEGQIHKDFWKSLYWIAMYLVQDQSACAIPINSLQRFAISKRTDDMATPRTKKQDECSQGFTKHATIFWNTGAVHLAPAGAFSAFSTMLAFIQCQELDAWTCSRVHTCKHDFLDWLLQVLFAYVCGLCCCWDMQLLKQAAYANRFGSWFLSDFQVIALMASLAAHRTPDQHVLEIICVRMVAGTSRAYFVLEEAKTCRNTICCCGIELTWPKHLAGK